MSDNPTVYFVVQRGHKPRWAHVLAVFRTQRAAQSFVEDNRDMTGDLSVESLPLKESYTPIDGGEF